MRHTEKAVIFAAPIGILIWTLIVTYAFPVEKSALEIPFEETPPPQIQLGDSGQIPTTQPDVPERKGNIDLKKVGAAMQTGRAETPAANSSTSSQDTREVSYVKAFGALLLVLALIVLGGYLLRRFSSKTSLLKGLSLADILGRVYLNPRATLYFVRTGGRVLVLGATPTQINLVAEFDASVFQEVEEKQPQTEADVQEKKNSFARLLALVRHRTREEESKQQENQTEDSIKALHEEIVRLQQYLKEMSRSENQL
ncbi:MAG TPA: flagellar biosynthetic protein FliO [Candidatus Hydrogenedentes bacterium]|nr:flagellar biosynthetic protein FliO [Candidatus Hydrogenedentota bacterium]HOL78027.1 flagellar biosynthetic protein FliO [Candidatus Hydrogenedentota bacterium]HPO84614.1 flagellar biosynthetic protein FliO [Candidatus Hydrogenedentota bacterium]